MFGAVFKGAGEVGEGATFLRVPAQERRDIDGLAARVEVGRGDALKREFAEDLDEGLEFGVAEAVFLCPTEVEAEVAVGEGAKIELRLRVDAETMDAGLVADSLRVLLSYQSDIELASAQLAAGQL